MLTRDNLRIPRTWTIYGGADTGTYMGGVCAAIDPNYELYVLDVYPNYHYTGDGTIELIGMTVGEWFKWVGKSFRHWSKQQKNKMWVDENTAFTTEVAWGVTFKRNRKRLELRTEITREYLRNNRIHVMPWCESILLYEMEEASYPDEESSSGVFKRVKKKDHCLDGLEHICSRRPHPDFQEEQKSRGGVYADMLAKYQQVEAMSSPPVIDNWLGQN